MGKTLLAPFVRDIAETELGGWMEGYIESLLVSVRDNTWVSLMEALTSSQDRELEATPLSTLEDDHRTRRYGRQWWTSRQQTAARILDSFEIHQAPFNLVSCSSQKPVSWPTTPPFSQLLGGDRKEWERITERIQNLVGSDIPMGLIISVSSLVIPIIIISSIPRMMVRVSLSLMLGMACFGPYRTKQVNWSKSDKLMNGFTYVGGSHYVSPLLNSALMYHTALLAQVSKWWNAKTAEPLLRAGGVPAIPLTRAHTVDTAQEVLYVRGRRGEPVEKLSARSQPEWSHSNSIGDMKPRNGVKSEVVSDGKQSDSEEEKGVNIDAGTTDSMSLVIAFCMFSEIFLRYRTELLMIMTILVLFGIWAFDKWGMCLNHCASGRSMKEYSSLVGRMVDEASVEVGLEDVVNGVWGRLFHETTAPPYVLSTVRWLLNRCSQLSFIKQVSEVEVRADGETDYKEVTNQSSGLRVLMEFQYNPEKDTLGIGAVASHTKAVRFFERLSRQAIIEATESTKQLETVMEGAGVDPEVIQSLKSVVVRSMDLMLSMTTSGTGMVSLSGSFVGEAKVALNRYVASNSTQGARFDLQQVGSKVEAKHRVTFNASRDARGIYDEVLSSYVGEGSVASMINGCLAI
eukprot:GHVN01088919.1.p1 GENE.GHVN01088919.1~~GHVN01088919.1.p1  ORF type:complete len:629 (-),score=95.69 GHVN01088919.1:149-2035(-)